jgi:hypothetical protein
MEYWSAGWDKTPVPGFHYSNTPLLQFYLDRIELSRIVIEKFPSQLGRNILPNVDRVDKLVFSGWIAVRIVGADK